MSAAPAGPPPADDVTARAGRVAEVAAEHAARHDQEASFPVEALAEMRATGLLGLLVPGAYGGLGGGVTDLLDAAIRIGRADMSVAMIFAMHCQQVAAVVGHAGPRLREELLPEIAAGRQYLASVTTEAGKGGHLRSAQAELDVSDGDLVVDRFAPIVTGGTHADGFLVTMRSPGATSPNQVSLVYARRDQLQLTATGDWQPMGMRASHSAPLRLDGRMPGHQIIGEHGGFARIASEVFAPLAHLGWSASWLGTACGALSRVLTLLRAKDSRRRFNRESELLLSRLGSARQRVDAVHALLRQTAKMVVEADDLSRPRNQLLLNTLKITAAEQCHAVVEDLIDAVGLQHGYLKGSPTGLERALRDLRSAALNYSNDRLRLADGRLALLDPEVRLA
ncbi:acyl-CoA dehydrogenase family protein [Amycolatopsis samaneae]|uniref:Acyl-CoA dehydrogenase family protein n=1 Tax=Amycolatopsis samaneae TaxID=664691 RepID=A0ABW5GTY6_9PSEU